MSPNICVQINCSKEVVCVSISIASISACILLWSSQVADRTCSQELGSSGNGHSTTLQHPNTAADICRPLRDSVKAWESIAATQYAFDGVLDGWDSDSEAPAESAEDKYLQVQNDMYRTGVWHAATAALKKHAVQMKSSGVPLVLCHVPMSTLCYKSACYWMIFVDYLLDDLSMICKYHCC